MEGVVFYEKCDGCLGEWGWEVKCGRLQVGSTCPRHTKSCDKDDCFVMMGQMEMSWNVSPRYEFLPCCTKLSLALQSACIVVTKQHFLYKGSPRADSQGSKGLRELKREKTKFKNNYDCKFQLPRNYKRDI